MEFGRKEALQYLEELRIAEKEARSNAASWSFKFAMQNILYNLNFIADCLAFPVNKKAHDNLFSHKSKQPYYRRHAKGWNK